MDWFFSEYFGFFPVSITPQMLETHSLIYHQRYIISQIYGGVKHVKQDSKRTMT